MSPEDNVPLLIQQLYSPDLFKRAAGVWQQKLTAHLERVLNRDAAVLNWQAPQDAIEQATAILQQGCQTNTLPGVPAESAEHLLQRFGALVDQILASGQNLHHPHYIGHQVPAPVPLAGLFDSTGTVTNQVMAVFEMGPWATAVEFSLLERLAAKIGWPAGQSAGVLTHGGSLANLTALLTARNVSFPGCWEQGIPRNAVLIAHEDAHYSVARAAGVLGLGSQQVIRVGVDSQRRMCPVRLNEALMEQTNAGRQVLAVSACACATPTGAFDPIPEIADVCQRHQVWLHVDAAHGGSVLLSRKHRHLVAGLERADSVVWDAHKMMFVPALCAAVLYRNKAHRLEAFRQTAPYLFDPSAPGMAEFDSGMGTLECTKRATGFGLWGLWSMLGDEVFEQMVDWTFELGQILHTMLKDADDFEPLHQPQCNIVAFRYLPDSIRHAGIETQNRFQYELRTRIIRSGSFYIVQTRLDDVVALRVTVMNPTTTKADLQELLDELRRQGQQIYTSEN
ncbi:MAG: hypothetical protein KDA96_15155 [Planctomycetaceae bacterium]|nr:hypothetical protein [Planctomycetaceae bacterium]